MAKVLLAVTGGIAAYKAIDLGGSLRKRGEEVRVIMTKAATRFATPLTFSAVSAATVYTDAFETENGIILHTTLSKWADILVVAPLTANTAAKLSDGIADNLLTMTALAFEGPKLAVPSMNVRMYENPVTVNNLLKLQRNGWNILEPSYGHLADGEYGKGRYPENDNILFEIDRITGPNDFKDVNVLVTAGPTQEPIDPVRYLTNRSSGKMGYEMAKAAKVRNANVYLISGPVDLKTPYGVERKDVKSSEEMKEAVLEKMEWADVVIMAAAVADYKPVFISEQKIKKNSDELNLHMAKTSDILMEISKVRRPRQFVIGFAAETQNALENAKHKLKSKGLDMIISNDVMRTDIGFDSEYNEVTVLCKNGDAVRLSRNKKCSIAKNILDIVKTHRVKLP